MGGGLMQTDQILALLFFEAMAAFWYVVAPRYSRWMVTLPLPRVVTRVDPGAWTFFFRTLCVAIGVLALGTLPGGAVFVVVIAVAAWAITAWRYRTPE